MVQNRYDETWHRLREWTKGQTPSERLAAQILIHEGFQNFDPSHPLGGRDGGKDAIADKDGMRFAMAAYFPRGQQTFNKIRTKFEGDLAGAKKSSAEAIAFVTNQELTLGERKDLRTLAAPAVVELYHLERITAILDTPGMASVREQFLDIEMDSKPTITLAKILSDPVLDNPVSQKLVAWGISLEWENNGGGRAKNFRSWFSMKRFLPDIPANFDCAPTSEVEQIPIVVEGKSIQKTGIARFPLADFEAVMRGEGQIYIWGKATYNYNDLLDGTPEHHTAFCVHVVISGNIYAPGAPFTYEHHSKQCNYAD
jgi:hypothetical protein